LYNLRTKLLFIMLIWNKIKSFKVIQWTLLKSSLFVLFVKNNLLLYPPIIWNILFIIHISKAEKLKNEVKSMLKSKNKWVKIKYYKKLIYLEISTKSKIPQYVYFITQFFKKVIKWRKNKNKKYNNKYLLLHRTRKYFELNSSKEI
jgi:hypothetical protein